MSTELPPDRAAQRSSAAPERGTAADAHRVRQRLNMRIGWGLALLALVFSALQLQVVPERLMQAVSRAEFILGIMFPPVVADGGELFTAAIESIQVAIVGTAFGILFSLVLGVLAARNISPLGPLTALIKGFAGFVRAVPALIWAVLFIVAVGLGPTPGILALAVNSIGMLVKIFAETIEEIDMGPVEALRTTGAGELQVFVQGVMPSIARVFIAWSIFRLDINVRYASVLGIVGAGGIGWELVQAAQQSRYDQAIGVTLVIFAMVMAAELVSDWLKRRVDAASARATA